LNFYIDGLMWRRVYVPFPAGALFIFAAGMSFALAPLSSLDPEVPGRDNRCFFRFGDLGGSAFFPVLAVKSSGFFS